MTITNRFAPCPKSPNCVSSKADTSDTQHYIEAIKAGDSSPSAKAKILEIVQDLPRTNIQVDEPNYMHVVFTTLIMRYKDDVEFEFETDGTVQVRSASRVGYSDLGANRKRIELIRSKL